MSNNSSGNWFTLNEPVFCSASVLPNEGRTRRRSATRTSAPLEPVLRIEYVSRLDVEPRLGYQSPLQQLRSRKLT
jgi:hypothetical protein